MLAVCLAGNWKAKSVSVLASFSDLTAIFLHRLCEHCTRFAYFNRFP